MPTTIEETKKPFVLWRDYGYEGWHPQGFDTIEAVRAEIERGITEEFVVTRAALVLQLEEA